MPNSYFIAPIDVGNNALEQGQLELATTEFEKIISTQPHNWQALYGLGLIAARRKNREKAEHYFRRAIEEQSSQPILYNQLGNTLLSQEKIHQAIEAYQKALQLDKHYAEAYNGLGNVYFQQQNFLIASHYYQKAIEFRSDYIGAWYNLGLSYIRQNELLAAINIFQRIITLHPHLPAVYYQLAKLYQQHERFEEAAENYEIALTYDPNLHEALYNLGIIKIQQQNYQLAEQYFQRVMLIEKKSPVLQYNLGVIAMRQRKLDVAIKHYQACLTLNPSYAQAHQNLANVFSELGKHQQAMEHYQTALDLDPNNLSVAYMLAALKKKNTFDKAPDTYLKNLFDNYASYYDQHLLETLDYQGPKILRKKVQEILGKPTASWTIIDLGCGTGLCGVDFIDYKHYLIGIDISSNMIAYARQRGIYDELIVNDILTGLRNLHRSVDLIIAADVFIYCGDLSYIFEESYRLLKTTGHLIFTIEKSNKSNFVLEKTARFSHHKKYIYQLAAKLKFRIVNCQEVALREQAHDKVKSFVFLLRKI